MKLNLRAASVGVLLATILVLGLGTVRAGEPRFAENPGDISRAQTILEGEGYLVSGSYTPGQLDEATREALSRYQERHSLNDSGTLDGDTFAMLLSHEISYPWSPQATAAAAEPVEPVAAPTPEPAPQLAEAVVPEPTPSTAEVKEAPAPPPAPEPEPVRTMPATASPLPLLVLLGVVLLGSGLFLLRRRTA